MTAQIIQWRDSSNDDSALPPKTGILIANLLNTVVRAGENDELEAFIALPRLLTTGQQLKGVNISDGMIYGASEYIKGNRGPLQDCNVEYWRLILPLLPGQTDEEHGTA